MLACLLTLALLPASALAAGWQSDWSAEYVQTAVDNGWLTEDANGDIPVNKAISRADFAVILWRVVGSPQAEGACPFTDVAAGEAQTAITALKEKGIVNGTSTTTFAPADTLSRQEGFVMLARAFSLNAENPHAAASFADWSSVESWAQNAIAALVEKDIVVGVGGNRLAPNQSITLGEMCKVAVSIYETASETISADNAITGVTTLGNVSTDGAKVNAIVVEYNVDLTGADVSMEDFEINDYGTAQGNSACEIGGNPGVPTKVYINDKPETSATGGSGSGKYVIIEVNTDYQLGSVPKYTQSMIADVLQTGTIRTAQYTITPGTEKVTNYTETESSSGQQGGAGGPGGDQQGPAGGEGGPGGAGGPGGGGMGGPGGNSGPTKTVNEGAYRILNTESFQLFTKEDGTAFHATDCWEELDNASYDEDSDHYVDVDLPYALFVPADYDASKSYALVLQIHDAGAMGTDPMITLTESQGSVNFASDEVQQIVKDAWGLGGMIVVSPQFEDAIRTTRDNWTLSAGVPATWQLLDYLTEQYSIDMDHIYGTGQSMGGMQVVAMAAQRDNYFAGVWANGCQWGTNYNLEEPYSSRGDAQTNTAAPADGDIIWTVDSDGNEVDYRNWFYLISDDNILITNCQGDVFSTNTWKELDFLYQDLAGTDPIPKAVWNPLTASKDAQNAAMNNLAAQESDRGFYWTAFEGGNHMATWIYSHGVFAHYQWLLTQSRDAEMAREKLDLDHPFVAAAEQIQTEDRLLAPDANGNNVYFVTGEAGAGTADYNSSWTQMGTTVLKEPNWKPAE